MRSAASSARAGPLSVRDVGGDRVAPLALDRDRLEVRGAGLDKGLGGDPEPENDARLLLHDPRVGPGARRDGRLGGDVARSQVLGKCPRNEISQLFAIRHRRNRTAGRPPHRRPYSSANTAIVAVKPCRKLRPPTGPISPAQKNPPAGTPKGILDRRRVVVGHPEHVRAAAVAGEQQDAGRPRRAERLNLARGASRAGPRRRRRRRGCACGRSAQPVPAPRERSSPPRRRRR